LATLLVFVELDCQTYVALHTRQASQLSFTNPGLQKIWM